MAQQEGLPLQPLPYVGEEIAEINSQAPRKRGRFHAYRKSFKREDVVMGYLFLLVPMGIFIVFFFLAMIFDFGVSFTEWNILQSPKFVGWQNYNYIFTLDPVYWTAVGNSIEYAFIVVPVQTALAFTLAVIVNQNIHGRSFFRTAFYFPSVTSSVAITLLFMWLFNQLGLVNYLLSLIQIGPIGPFGPVGWLTDPAIVLKSIMGLNIWTTSGTYMIIFLAALQEVPRDLYEAAAIDGANAWKATTRITIPLIRPALFLIVATGLIGCLQIFDQAFVVSGGQGGPQNATMTMVLYIYDVGISNGFYGRAAAASFVMFCIIFLATLLVRRLIREEGAY